MTGVEEPVIGVSGLAANADDGAFSRILPDDVPRPCDQLACPNYQHAAELHALVAAGGFHRLAPDWWPEPGQFAVSTRPVLKRVEAGLQRGVG